jgi:diaminohydroxyphosphoribosylaminopyrimidine deaminase/5-amino-6-(5-phosphoribosylamino)uracil reductase
MTVASPNPSVFTPVEMGGAGPWSAADVVAMRRALELARHGIGRVEPNPPVGAVVTTADGRLLGEGWHARFGGPHAEVEALEAAGTAARGATLFVTLEPCCHHGKTPPCTDAILAAGIGRVVAATGDPFPAVGGGGFAALRAAGVRVETGLLEADANRITAPFRTLVTTGRPWVIAKWAMSLDGRATAPPGTDRWISSAESRKIVHDLRGRIDAIAVGIGTVLEDDPLLTARPGGTPSARQPLRVVLDSVARLPLESRLVCSAREVPVLVAVGPAAPQERCAALATAGCEVWRTEATDPPGRLVALLHELGARRHTHLLVEGGPSVFRTLFAADLADEIWAFVAPSLFGPPHGGPDSATPVPVIPTAPPFDVEEVRHVGDDLFVQGLVRHRDCRWHL